MFTPHRCYFQGLSPFNIFLYVQEWNTWICPHLTHLAWSPACFISEQAMLLYLTHWEFGFSLVQPAHYMNICISCLLICGYLHFKKSLVILKKALKGEVHYKIWPILQFLMWLSYWINNELNHLNFLVYNFQVYEMDWVSGAVLILRFLNYQFNILVL